MKIPKLFSILLLTALFTTLYSQDNSRYYEAKYYYSNGNGNTSDLNLTTVQPPPKKSTPEMEALLQELREARLNNDLVKANVLQNRLNEICGASTNLSNHNSEFKSPIIRNFEKSDALPVIFETDYQLSQFSSAGLWGIQTMTSNKSNAVFAAVSRFVSGGPDSVLVYVSYNGGASWVRKGAFGGFATGVDCRPGEIDIEVIINGSDTLAFVVVGLNWDPGTGIKAYASLFRFNIGTGVVDAFSWNFGGSLSSPSVSTYNPKITSDNTVYSGASYVYVTVSHDSLIGGGNKRTTQRYGVFLNPFGSFTITYRVANPSGGGFWWFSSSTEAATYLWQDICYYDAPGDRIYTLFNHTGSGASPSDIYIAWSNDYGTSNSGNLGFNQTNTVMQASVASNAGTGQQTLCIGFRRQFSGNDWDFAVQYTTTGGTTTGSFTLSYTTFTSANTLMISLQAFKTQAGRYSFAWVDSVAGSSTDGNHFYRQTTNSGFSYTSLQLQTNSIPGDRTYGGTKAGYVPTGSDNCLVIWSATVGTNGYCSYLICSTVGMGNETGIPEIYSLNQNYPNPFNPTTSIKFTIPKAELVKLVVYDILGKEVATLVNTNLQPGEYTLNFNAGELPSGVYFYKLTAGDFSDTKKMTLIK